MCPSALMHDRRKDVLELCSYFHNKMSRCLGIISEKSVEPVIVFQSIMDLFAGTFIEMLLTDIKPLSSQT